MDAMGCMLLRECTDGVEEVTSLLDISSRYPNTDDFYIVANEFNNMLVSLNQVGVKVFLADSKYFPVGHRGVYHTVSNNFFLNKKHMGNPGVLMSVMRHEGWHAAQDCMAGTIKNSMIAIIMPEEEVPVLWRVMAERTYPANAVPWEAEASWAGKTENMTMEALEACANGNMWKVYEPTPLTKKWLQENNYLPHIEYDHKHHGFHYHPTHSHWHYHRKTDVVHAHEHTHGNNHGHHRKKNWHPVTKRNKHEIIFHVH